MDTLEPADFLECCRSLPLVDVRSPGEFAEGHICGARNLALFDNPERAEIGTLYKKGGHNPAVKRGLAIALPKRESLVQQARAVAPEGALALHCWRGGLRSEKMAELLEQHGLRCTLLRGGYKAYRAHIRACFENLHTLRILAGPTGSGKTDILTELTRQGEQVVDLEGLANHRGSAFGALGQPPQPTTEQFHNLLFDRLQQLDLEQRIWLESESKTIGRAYLPEELYEAMKRAPIMTISIPHEIRLQRLAEEYGQFPREDLIACVRRIERRFGPEKVKACVELLEQDRIIDVAEQLIGYYDASYLNSRKKNHRHPIQELTLENERVEDWARQLIDAVQADPAY